VVVFLGNGRSDRSRGLALLRVGKMLYLMCFG
jgi:hypothetical protein